MQNNMIPTPSQQPQQSSYASPFISPDAIQFLITMQNMAIESKNTAIINLQLQYQLRSLQNYIKFQQNREDAYNNVFTLNDEATFTRGRTGAPTLLMDDIVKEAYLLLPEAPASTTPFFMIILKKGGTLLLYDMHFNSDAQLINAFRQHGVHVNILRSRRTSANLLQDAIYKQLQCLSFPFYGGWESVGNKDNICYIIFSNYSTCRPKHSNDVPSPLPSQSKAVTSTAVNQFWPAFEIIRTSFLRDMVILLYHEAALHTLLRELGYKFPLACCFFSTENRVLEFFRTLLLWFDCPPLTLDAHNSDFSYGLLSRKDQPLLIEDSGRLSHAAKNIDILVSAMTNDTVAWKRGRETPQSLPMQAPVTLLSSCPSALNCSTDSMVLDFSIEDFDVEAWLDCADQVGQNQDYLTAFCGYASQHISELRNALEEGKKVARYSDGGKLFGKYLQAYGILMGVRSFLENFFAYAMPESPAFSLSNEELSVQMLNLLVQTMEKADRSTLADQFLDVARRFIETRTLCPHPTDRCPVDTNSTVLYNTDYLYFPSSPFKMICDSIGQSCPVINKALEESDLFRGARTNKETVKTRITVWDAYGKNKLLAVYAFSRDAFDVFGAPLPLDTEELS